MSKANDIDMYLYAIDNKYTKLIRLLNDCYYHWLWGAFFSEEKDIPPESKLNTLLLSYKKMGQVQALKQKALRYRSYNLLIRFLIRLVNYDDLFRSSLIIAYNELNSFVDNLKSANIDHNKKSQMKIGKSLSKCLANILQNTNKFNASVVEFGSEVSTTYEQLAKYLKQGSNNNFHTEEDDKMPTTVDLYAYNSEIFKKALGLRAQAEKLNYDWLWGRYYGKDTSKSPTRVKDILRQHETTHGLGGLREKATLYRSHNIFSRFFIRLINYDDLYRCSILTHYYDVMSCAKELEYTSLQHIKKDEAQDQTQMRSDLKRAYEYIKSARKSGSALGTSVYAAWLTLDSDTMNGADNNFNIPDCLRKYYSDGADLGMTNHVESNKDLIQANKENVVEALKVFGIECSIGSSFSLYTFKKIWRDKSKSSHPDKGGSHDAYVEVTKAKEIIDKTIDEHNLAAHKMDDTSIEDELTLASSDQGTLSSWYMNKSLEYQSRVKSELIGRPIYRFRIVLNRLNGNQTSSIEKALLDFESKIDKRINKESLILKNLLDRYLEKATIYSDINTQEPISAEQFKKQQLEDFELFFSNLKKEIYNLLSDDIANARKRSPNDMLVILSDTQDTSNEPSSFIEEKTSSDPGSSSESSSRQLGQQGIIRFNDPRKSTDVSITCLSLFINDNAPINSQSSTPTTPNDTTSIELGSSAHIATLNNI